MIKVGLVGCGALGRTHTNALAELDDARMTAFCDINEDAAKALCDEAGGDYYTTDFDRLLEDESLQAIYVCTRHDSHAELCVRAAEAGKHVLVEKPLALTVEDCRAVGAAVERTGIKLMPAFKMRYYELIARAREIVPEPLVVTMQMMDNRWADDMWANDPVQGGGNVMSQGCHSCDIMRFVARRDPLWVSAVGGNYYQPTGVADNICAVFQFEGGVAGNLVQGDAGLPPLVSKFYMQIFAEGISVTLHNRFCTMTIAERGKEPQVIEGEETGFLEENRAFIAAIADDTPVPMDHMDGLLATLMPMQAIASAADGEPKHIKSLLDDLS
ncbi:MAG: Gfo/Idh/MocA family oxidoreductase [Armatimonadetes bacterium]|nr:Gfo/Idh/MocA family oxidoreductase [Armatimonadota bacterium]